MITKLCSGCCVNKPLNDFGRHAKGKHGVRSKCKGCVASKNSDWYLRNREDRLAKGKEWYRNNKDHHSELTSTWYAANKPEYSKNRAAQREQNIDDYRARSRKHYAMNKGIYAIKSKVRRGICKFVTPLWADMAKIDAIYESAARISRETGERYEVDHIVPLTPPMIQSLELGNPIRARVFVGPLIPVVQGLHCQANLAVEHYKDNIRKSNRRWPDMPTLII